MMGYCEGMKVVCYVIRLVNELGVKVLILYVFFIENWKCFKIEVEFLMKLSEEFLIIFLFELIEKNV